jgi:lipid II:glycine glycyltransferase (peptidoglycan interpeptide bridge formation enzyme)
VSGYAVVENPSAELWNSFLKKNSPEGNLGQCFEFAEITKMAYPRAKIARLSIMYNGEPFGIVQGTYSSYFGFGMTLKVIRGPIVNGETKENLRLVENILKELEDYCKRKRIIHAEISVPDSWQLQGIFHKMAYALAAKIENEYVVNLEEGAQKLWQRIDHNKRRNIKKAMKEGVEIVQSNSHEDLKTYYSMLQASAKRKDFSTYPPSWFEALWKTYKPELSKVFLAYWKGKSVSGVHIVIQGKTVYALSAGSLPEGWEVRPNDILHWKAMEWACQNGYSKYDMGTVSEPPPTEESSEWGLWRWKREWKGSLERIQTFEKTFLPRYKLILQAKKLVERGLRALGD